MTSPSSPDPVLDGAFARAWFETFRTTFASQAARLADLDRQAGDGDFGANLTSALTRAQGFVDADDPQTYADVFFAVSKGFLDTGGTSGPLFGMWFRDLAKAADGPATVSTLARNVSNQARAKVPSRTGSGVLGLVIVLLTRSGRAYGRGRPTAAAARRRRAAG